jgi:hypothetical protein
MAIGIFAVDPGKVFDYIPKACRKLPEEQQVVFQCKPLNAKAAASLEDKSVDATMEKGNTGNTMRIYSGSTVLRALNKGLVGWKNFKLSPDSPEIEFLMDRNNKEPQPQMIDFIPADVRKELAEFITTGKDLTEDEAKNSD